MNMLRKLAWAAMLVGAGVPSTQAPRPDPAPPARPHASPPASAPAPALAEAPPAAGWPLDFEDEFEGEAWSFWPWARRGD